MLLPITTGLSTPLMDDLTAYHNAGIAMISSFAFPVDVEIALRQELNAAVAAVFAAAARNPRTAPTVTTEVDLRVPRITTTNAEVFGFELPPAPPALATFNAV
jgi:hypothetical protein